MNASFSERLLEPQDVPFVVDSFARSYRVIGHVAGLLDKFREVFIDPFRALVLASSADPSALIQTRIVFPVSEPSEIAGYSVVSMRHSCLVYTLTKPTYSGRRIAAHLLSHAPMTASGNQTDPRPYITHCLSTANFARMVKHLELRTRYSPLLFCRLAEEATEETNT